MAKYDVYGIGNALVDMEYEVEVADLEALGIDKGVMTLVDEEQQLRMMAHLAAHPHQRSSGGSAANAWWNPSPGSSSGSRPEAGGLFTVQGCECLGACGDAPVMLVNDRNMCSFMSNDKLDQLISGLRGAED